MEHTWTAEAKSITEKPTNLLTDWLGFKGCKEHFCVQKHNNEVRKKNWHGQNSQQTSKPALGQQLQKQTKDE